MMRTQKRKHGFSKFTLGAITLVVSLALLLGSAQTTLAKNTPSPDPSLQSGVTDGGGGDGQVDFVLEMSPNKEVARSVKRRQPRVFSLSRENDTNSFGSSVVFEQNVLGYYDIVVDLFKLNLIDFWRPTLTRERSDYESK